MIAPVEVQLRTFILLPLGTRSVALPAESVIELVAPGKLQEFPHGTPWLSGAIIRRGRVVPVCDVGKLLGEPEGEAGRFYLIAEWQSGKTRDWCAIPVAGECELASAESTLPAEGRAPHIAGLLPVHDGQIEILDVGALLREQERRRDSTAERKS
jgi:chemotaxis signal transduction protein